MRTTKNLSFAFRGCEASVVMDERELEGAGSWADRCKETETGSCFKITILKIAQTGKWKNMKYVVFWLD